MYENIKILNSLPTSYLFVDRWKISCEEIEDIFLEVIDSGFLFGIFDAFTKHKITEIKHLNHALIYISNIGTLDKAPLTIDDCLMQKFISRLEYLNLKIKRVEVVNNNWSNFLVKIECYF